MHWSIRSSFGLIGIALAVVSTGCGGSNGNSNPDAAGIWKGEDSTNGMLLTGIVDANGAADFIRADGAQFVGQATPSGSNVSFALQGVTQFGSAFGTNGPTYGSGTFSASVDSGEGGSSLAGTLSFTPNGGTAANATWSMNFYVIYNGASALGLLAGTYGDVAPIVANGVDPLAGATISITSGGQISGQNPNNSCVINGTVSIVNAAHDVYQVSYTLSSCVDTGNASYSDLNGVTFSGLAYQDPTYNPILVNIGVTGLDSAGHHYGIVSQLTAN